MAMAVICLSVEAWGYKLTEATWFWIIAAVGSSQDYFRCKIFSVIETYWVSFSCVHSMTKAYPKVSEQYALDIERARRKLRGLIAGKFR